MHRLVIIVFIAFDTKFVSLLSSFLVMTLVP